MKQNDGMMGDFGRMMYGKNGPPKLKVPFSARVARAAGCAIAAAFCLALVFGLAVGCLELWNHFVR
jgi:hypothetical protein